MGCCRVCWIRLPAQTREREANHSESSAAERRSLRTATRGSGCGPEAGLQPDDEVSDQFGLVSEVGVFCDAGVTRAVLTAIADVIGDR